MKRFGLAGPITIVGMFAGGLACLLVTVASLGQAGEDPSSQKRPSSGQKSRLPPLKIDKSAPLLLLDDARPSTSPAGKPVADNDACFVCHGNYRKEPLVAWHAKGNIGCIACHGPSMAHREDEHNVTLPDTLYPADKIDAMCRKCHEEHNTPARKVIDAWQKRCPKKTDPAAIVCTDCHGTHRLESRMVRWDKSTRKLLGKPPSDTSSHTDEMK